MTRFLLFLVALVPFSALGAAPATDITFANLKELLEAGNARVRAARLELEAASERTGFLTRSFLPSLDLHGAQESFVSGRHGRKEQAAYGGELRLNVFNGGLDGIENDIRGLAEESKRAESLRVGAEELEKARIAFWQLVYLREKEAVLRQAAETNSQNLAAARKRIRSGVAADSDRFEFEMKDVDLKRELAALAVETGNQRRALALRLGLTGREGSLRVPEKLGHDHDIEVSLAHSPRDREFLHKEAELKAGQLALSSRAGAREWWPKLDLFAGYSQFNEREKEQAAAADRTESVIGARLSLSFAAGLGGFRESAARARESAAAAALADFSRSEVESGVKGELEELSYLHGQVHDAEENIVRAERYYKLTQAEYTRGVKNSPDVLGASEKLFAMRHKRLEIIRDFQLAKAHLLSKIGR